MNNFNNLIWNSKSRKIVVVFLRTFMPIRKGRVLCVCWGGRKYGCNPKSISDYIINSQNDRFEIPNASRINPITFGKIYKYHQWTNHCQFQ